MNIEKKKSSSPVMLKAEDFTIDPVAKDIKEFNLKIFKNSQAMRKKMREAKVTSQKI
jgi:hypothetical protein